MKTNATNFYYLKLRNLFLAHQETYDKLEKNTLNDAIKSNLRKKLFLYEGEIRKLLTEKCSTGMVRRGMASSDTSTFFTINKRRYAHQLTSNQLVHSFLKDGTSTRYFVKKRGKSSPSLETELNSFENINGSNASKFLDCLQEISRQRSMDTKLDDGKISLESSLEDKTPTGSEYNAEQGEVIDLSPLVDDEQEELSKVDFFRKLGLVSREEHEELTNRKNSRKRRTTANPQFSHAAIEAKRQTQMEINAERKNRRQNTVVNKSAVPSGGGNRINLFAESKSQRNFKIDNKQLYPGLYLVKRITNAKYFCKVCSDICQCSIDTVIVCKRCSTFFHLTCILPKKSIPDLLELSCPGCSTSSSHTHKANPGKRNELLKRFLEKRKCIISLTHANQVLRLLSEKRELEKSEVLGAIDNLKRKSSHIVNCLDLFEYKPRSNSDQAPISAECFASSESSFVEKTDSSELSLCTGSELNPGNLSAQPSMDGFDELESTLYTTDEVYNNKETATKCDTDLPVLTFCV